MRAVLVIAKLTVREIFRKKDFYVAFVLAGVILFYAQGLQFYNVRNLSRYLAEMGLALIWLFSVVLCSALAARQYPAEVRDRTLAPLMARPVRRAHFVLGKFLGAFAASACAFTLFFGTFLGVLYAKAGAIDTAAAGQTYLLFLLNLAVLSSMTSAFSYSLTVSANVTVSLVVYHLVSLYGEGLRETARTFQTPVREIVEGLYFALPHFEFFDLRQRFIHGWEGLSFQALSFVTLYAAAYVSFFLLMAMVSFRKKSI